LERDLTRKGKGDLAELKVACDLVQRGYRVAIPYGEDSDFDLILSRGGSLERVQVKYSSSRDGVLLVKCRSHSLTNGKVRRVKHYTSRVIDWLAIWDSTTDRCFYVPASELGAGRSVLHLRLAPARNGQVAGIRNAEDYCDVGATGRR
jgi:PD-(D/E)XK endonuclease